MSVALDGVVGDPASSFVVVDAGSVYTKAFLLDDVEGERRLISVGRVPSMGDDGQPEGAQAIEHAISHALRVAGRELGTGASGSDDLARVAPGTSFRAMLVPGGNLPRVMVVGARQERLQSTISLVERLPVRQLEPVPLDDHPERLLSAVEAQLPDAVIVSGEAPGVLGSRAVDIRQTRAALEALRFGLPAGAGRPLVVYVGDEVSGHEISILFGETPCVIVAEGDSDGLSRSLAKLVAERTREWLGGEAGMGLGVSGSASSEVSLATRGGTPASSLSGVCAATEMIAERYDVDVLTLDLGAGHAMAVLTTGTSGRRRVVTVARDDLGLRSGRWSVLDLAGSAAIERWLPMDTSVEALRADARRGLLCPASLPEREFELLLEHAFAREALRLCLADLPRAAGVERGMPPVDLIIGSGGVLASVPRLMQAALILLDAVQPQALTQLALDRATALPVLGHLAASLGHSAIGSALERDGLLNLGLCVAPSGTGREGETAIKVEVAYASRSPVTVEVPYGAIEVVPLPLGERASLKLWPSRDFDVGLGRGNAATPRAEVEGGAVGIIIDARGRPLTLPDSPEKRQAKLMQWLQATRAYPHLSFVPDARVPDARETLSTDAVGVSVPGDAPYE